jgi:carbon-monoxide dehydrogenase medium subunit
MSLYDVKLHFPLTLPEAFELLEELEDARVLAGGTDLLVDIKQGLVEAKHLIALQNIEALRTIDIQDGQVRLGAMVTPQKISTHPLVAEHFPVLGEAARSMASTQIRSMATIGGNIASAVPSADLPPSLMALGASVKLECSQGSRDVSLADFFTGPRDTVCGGGEILTAVVVPFPPPDSGTSYQKLTLREVNALAVASAASSLTLSKEVISSARIILGAVAPTPLLAAEASDLLVGKMPSDDSFQQAAARAQEESRPISDIRGSIWFRKELVRVLVYRSLSSASDRALAGDQGGK